MVEPTASRVRFLSKLTEAGWPSKVSWKLWDNTWGLRCWRKYHCHEPRTLSRGSTMWRISCLGGDSRQAIQRGFSRTESWDERTDLISIGVRGRSGTPGAYKTSWVRIMAKAVGTIVVGTTATTLGVVPLIDEPIHTIEIGDNDV